MSELIKADNEYKEWITGISTDFRKSQIRASMKINDEMLRFYWKLGKGISSMSEQFGYGMGFYKTVSDDLKSILPDVKSFSPTNLKYMRYLNIPLRRSRLSGKMETTCPDRRKPL